MSLPDSARRTQLLSADSSFTPPRNWSLSTDTTKADLEQAILATDLFPRAVLLLRIFKGLRMAGAVTLLGADPMLIRKGAGNRAARTDCQPRRQEIVRGTAWEQTGH